VLEDCVDTVVEPCEDCMSVLEALFIVLVNRDWDIDDHVAVRLVQERPASRGGSEVKREPGTRGSLGANARDALADERELRLRLPMDAASLWYNAVSAGVCAKHCSVLTRISNKKQTLDL